MDIDDDKGHQGDARHDADVYASALADTRRDVDIEIESTRSLVMASSSSSSPSSSMSPETTSSSTPTSSSPSTSPLPYDLNVSNGTCYYAPDEPMDPGFIPCGNAASDTKPCCWKGDICLGDDACFGVHQGVYTTYMGGCTDGTGTLTNIKCPQKPSPYASEPWIGLAYCNGTSDEWIACPQEESPSVIKGAGPCVCPAVTQQRIVAFRDASVLPSYASLPTAAGASIKWLGGYTPTVGSMDATGGPTPGGSSTSRVPLIVGLSVGMSVVLLALAGVFALYKRRARKDTGEMVKSESMGGGDRGTGPRAHGAVGDVVACSPPKETDAPQTTSMAISELEIRPARPWSMRSELDGAFPVAVAGASTTGHGVDGPPQGHAVSRMSSGRVYGSLSPMTTGPLLAEALDDVSTHRTGRSSVSAQTPLHTGQTADSRRHASMHSINDRRPPFETLVELE